MKSKNKTLNFRTGIKDGFPIAIGYIAVAFAFGISSYVMGIPPWVPILTSLTSFTGTGQFVGVNLMSGAAKVTEILAALIIINSRYFLMSISLSQRFSKKMPLWQRCIVAFGNTDEVYAVAMNNLQSLDFGYLMGLIFISYTGWVAGTSVGVFANHILPFFIITAFGIMLYAMFVAIIVPPAKENKAVLFVIILASILACIFRYIPPIKEIGRGWAVIIGGILSAVVGALLFPSDILEVEEIE